MKKIKAYYQYQYKYKIPLWLRFVFFFVPTKTYTFHSKNKCKIFYYKQFLNYFLDLECYKQWGRWWGTK